MSETPEEMNKHLDEMTLLLYVERQLDREAALARSLGTHQGQEPRSVRAQPSQRGELEVAADERG